MSYLHSFHGFHVLLIIFYLHLKKLSAMQSKFPPQSEGVSRADCFKACLSAGDDREGSPGNRSIIPIKMIIFPFKMLPLRKARLSQQTACLVIHDKTSLWMTNEASFTSLHSTRVISDCVRWGQNSHLTLLIGVVVLLKGEREECWVKSCLHAWDCDAREMILLIRPSCWVLPAENAMLSHSHFWKKK